jgi:hypothetical protein
MASSSAYDVQSSSALGELHADGVAEAVRSDRGFAISSHETGAFARVPEGCLKEIGCGERFAMMDEQPSAQLAGQLVREAACRLAVTMRLQRADRCGRFLVPLHEAFLVGLTCRDPQSRCSVRIRVQAINFKSPNLIASRATPASHQEQPVLEVMIGKVRMRRYR